jgi:hypothetical protein
MMALLMDMPPAGRIALARKLLPEGWVVARDVAAHAEVGEFMIAENERERMAMLWARLAGWNACRAAMLGEGE